MRGRDEHRTSSLCGVSTFLNKLSPTQHAYFKKASKFKIIAYADPDCCFKGRGPGVSLADGRMLVGQLFELSGGGGGGGVNTCIPKQTYIPVICQDARACVCVCLSVYVGCPEPHSPPLDPYLLDTCDLFVLLCHTLGMSSIRVKFLGLLYIHALFQRGGGLRTHWKSQYYRVP